MRPVTIYKGNIAAIVSNVIAIPIGIVPEIVIYKKWIPKAITWVPPVPSSIPTPIVPTPIVPSSIPSPSIPTPIVPAPSQSHSYVTVSYTHLTLPTKVTG